MAYLERIEPKPGLADAFVRFWEDGVRGDCLPDRARFDALNLRRWIGFISIYEYVAERDDFRNRLEGTMISEMTGEDWTGRFASEVDRRFDGAFLQELHGVARSRAPLRSKSELYQKDFIRVEKVLLPIAGPEGDVAQVFLGMFPLSERRIRYAG